MAKKKRKPTQKAQNKHKTQEEIYALKLAQKKRGSMTLPKAIEEAERSLTALRKLHTEEVMNATPMNRLNNNADPESRKTCDSVDEDAQKDAIAVAEAERELATKPPEEHIERLKIDKEVLEDEAADLQLEIDTEPGPFDPASLVANILKKKNENA